MVRFRTTIQIVRKRTIWKKEQVWIENKIDKMNETV